MPPCVWIFGCCLCSFCLKLNTRCRNLCRRIGQKSTGKCSSFPLNVLKTKEKLTAFLVSYAFRFANLVRTVNAKWPWAHPKHLPVKHVQCSCPCPRNPRHCGHSLHNTAPCGPSYRQTPVNVVSFVVVKQEIRRVAAQTACSDHAVFLACILLLFFSLQFRVNVHPFAFLTFSQLVGCSDGQEGQSFSVDGLLTFSFWLSHFSVLKQLHGTTVHSLSQQSKGWIRREKNSSQKWTGNGWLFLSE